MVPQGIGHGLENIGSTKARLIIVYPHPSPNREVLDDVEYENTSPPSSVFVRKIMNHLNFNLEFQDMIWLEIF